MEGGSVGVYRDFFRLWARRAAWRLTCSLRETPGAVHQALIRRWEVRAELYGQRGPPVRPVFADPAWALAPAWAAPPLSLVA